MSDSGDGWFWGIAALALGGYIIYDKYWAEPDVEALKTSQEQTYQVANRPSVDLPVGFLSSGTKWLVDSSSVKGSRSSRQGWITEDHSKDASRSERTTMTLWVVNCETGSYQNPSTVSYDAEGSVISADHKKLDDTSVQYAVPESRGSRVLGALCMEGFDTPLK